MSEATPEAPATPASETPAEPKADETDWKAEARKWEQRAKENKSAAEKLAELEESKKTELEKERDRAKAAEQRATLAEQVALKTRIAAETNVPIEVLHGDDEETIRAAAERVIAWRDSNKPAPPSPKKLKSGSTGSGDSALDGKERAAAALRQLRSGN